MSIEYKGVKFDDYVEEEFNTWSQVCDNHFPDEVWDELPIDTVTCGVEGCCNTATHYIDLNK